MSKPPKKEFNLVERINLLKKNGFNIEVNSLKPTTDQSDLLPLPERIKIILGIIQNNPVKATTMNYLILYDIENDKVRSLTAKFLLQKGCIRIQKSVFLAHSTHKKFDEIKKTLAEINEIYNNNDSIILVPINVSDSRSMKLIGKNVNIEHIVEPPNTIFF